MRPRDIGEAETHDNYLRYLLATHRDSLSLWECQALAEKAAKARDKRLLLRDIARMGFNHAGVLRDVLQRITNLL